IYGNYCGFWALTAFNTRNPLLFQGFRLQAQIPPTRLLLVPILLDPRFPTLACGRVAPRKGECRNVGIGDLQSLIGVFWQDAHIRAGQRRAADAVEDVALEFGPVFARYSHVAAVIEGFLQGLAQFILAGKLRNPPLQRLVYEPGRYFQLIGIYCVLWAVGVARSRHARVSSNLEDFESICTSGLYECTGAAGSFNISKASSSWLRVNSVAFAAAHKPFSELNV